MTPSDRLRAHYAHLLAPAGDCPRLCAECSGRDEARCCEAIDDRALCGALHFVLPLPPHHPRGYRWIVARHDDRDPRCPTG